MYTPWMVSLITIAFPMRPLHVIGFNLRHLCKVLTHLRTLERLKPEGAICLFDLLGLVGRLCVAIRGGLMPSNPAQCRLSASPPGDRGVENTAHSTLFYNSGGQGTRAHPRPRQSGLHLAAVMQAWLALSRDSRQHLVTQTRGLGAGPRLSAGSRREQRSHHPVPVPGMWEGRAARRRGGGAFLRPREGSRRGVRGARCCPPLHHPTGRAGAGAAAEGGEGPRGSAAPGRPGGRKR